MGIISLDAYFSSVKLLFSMKIIKRLLALLAILIVVYLLGPKPEAGTYTRALPVVTATGSALEEEIRNEETSLPVKPDNEARIIWYNDSTKEKTPYSIIYLPGFTASQEEGDPVHRNLAKAIGANLYLARLSEHGLESDSALYNMTATSLWESAKKAYAIGKQIGEKVIILATSNGGTLSLMLASEQYPEIAGLVLLSPNIKIFDPKAQLLNKPWGLQIARLVMGSEYTGAKDTTAIYRQYWNNPYRLEAVVQVQQLLEDKMHKETFAKVNQPLLMLYYYKDEENQDKVVRVTAMKEMFEEITTPQNKKQSIAVPTAGDHVMGSPIKSKDVQTVEAEAIRFTREVIMKN
ncbi:MAG: alpha/beta hydrolase [Sphingobacteriales bacterium]